MIIAAALAAMSTGAQASGYRFGSQSITGQSTADANGAEAIDASTIFYNPAGMVRLDGTQMNAGLTVVVPHSTYSESGSAHFTGAPTGGGAARDFAPNDVVAPSLYLSRQLDARWHVGLGVFVPYGAKLDYGDTWAGRYAVSRIKLTSIAINPSASFQIDEHHALGYGVTAEHMKAKLAQAVDVPGAVAALGSSAAGVTLLRQIAALGGNPAVLANVKDGEGHNDGQDWGYGWNLGYLYQMDAATRFGLAYRSSIKHELKGSTVWDFSQSTTDPIVNKVLAAASHRANSPALMELRTPETLSANAFRQIDSAWAAMADITWTRSSRLDNLNIQFPGTGEGDEVIRQHWKNTYRFSVGGTYQYNAALQFRAGLAHDQSPVRDASLTHAALPDSDRNQLSLGAHWQIDPQSAVDLAYSYLRFQDAPIDYRNACNPLTVGCTGNGEVTRGAFQTHIQLLGLAYNRRF
jgi:long-chain fatty acid transport protein